MVRIEFETDNASFQDGNDGLDLLEVADAIKAVAERIRDGNTSGAVIDSNGNTVGKYVVE